MKEDHQCMHRTQDHDHLRLLMTAVLEYIFIILEALMAGVVIYGISFHYVMKEWSASYNYFFQYLGEMLDLVCFNFIMIKKQFYKKN